MHTASVFAFDKLYVLVSVVGAYWLLQQYLSYRRLAHIPGPTLAAWSNLWLVRAIWRQQSHLDVGEVSKKYGSMLFPSQIQEYDH